VSFLIDTCALAELVKLRPHAGVLAWFEAQNAETLHLSALTVGEIEKGVALIPAGRRRTALRTWPGTPASTYSSRVLQVDVVVAAAWGRLCAAAEQNGRRLSVVDGLTAATAIHHGLTVVTRNTKDFAPTGAPLLDPWRTWGRSPRAGRSAALSSQRAVRPARIAR
jgi:predicted nucleic acid-binding protein